jgi:fructose-1,6-bisphosphatase/inositol monophosphatase family enzyme
MVKGRLEQAVIYDPTRNDLFCATKGPRRLPERPPHPRGQAHLACATAC